MILDVADLLVRHGIIARAAAAQIRVAFLKTTEPTLLVFGERQRHPLFVVKVGEEKALACRLSTTGRLHALLPEAIAKPVGVFALDDGRGLMVEEGLPGVPWFRLGDRCKTAADWRALRTRAIARLSQFHAAVATEPEWVAPPRSLDLEMADMVDRLQDDLAALGERGFALIDRAKSEFAALGPVRGVSQHGDFVVNNLLVDDSALYILDFAEFGKWRAPFVDAFALAHSMNLLAREHVGWPHLTDDLAACAAAEGDSGSLTPRQKLAFFVYFLLAAMIDTIQKPTRSAIRSIYRATFRDLLDDASRYEQAFGIAFPAKA